MLAARTLAREGSLVRSGDLCIGWGERRRGVGEETRDVRGLVAGGSGGGPSWVVKGAGASPRRRPGLSCVAQPCTNASSGPAPRDRDDTQLFRVS